MVKWDQLPEKDRWALAYTVTGILGLSKQPAKKNRIISFSVMRKVVDPDKAKTKSDFKKSLAISGQRLYCFATVKNQSADNQHDAYCLRKCRFFSKLYPGS